MVGPFMIPKHNGRIFHIFPVVKTNEIPERVLRKRIISFWQSVFDRIVSGNDVTGAVWVMAQQTVKNGHFSSFKIIRECHRSTTVVFKYVLYIFEISSYSISPFFECTKYRCVR